MRSRTRMIAAGAAISAALAAGSGAALAAAAGGKPGAPAKTASASQKPGASQKQGGSRARDQSDQDAITANVARQLHVTLAQVSAALQPMFAAGYADPSSPAFAAAARALGVSPAQLNSVLVHAKLSVSAAVNARQAFAGTKARSAKANGSAPGSKSAEEQQGHDAMTAAVAGALHVSTARVAAALQPLFAAGHADTSSPAFAAAARSLGVSTAQLNAALASAKQSLAAAG